MKNHITLKTTIGALVCAGALLNASVTRANTYHVTVNTAPLTSLPLSANGPFYVDYQLNYGDGSPNSAVVSDVLFGGGSAVGLPTVYSGTTATGNLGGSITMSAGPSSPYNEIFQGFNPGSSLSFDVSLTANPSILTPTTFTFAILDSLTFQIPTTDPLGLSLAQFDVDSSGHIVAHAYSGANVPDFGGDYSAITVSVTPVPEPSTTMAGIAALGFAGFALFRSRKPAKKAA